MHAMSIAAMWRCHPARKAVALCLALLLLLCIGARGSQSVSLAWNPNPGPGVAGYALYYGAKSGQYSTRIDAGTNTMTTVTGLKEGTTNFFAVTAYNSAGVESPRSAEVQFIAPGMLVMAPKTKLAAATLKFPVASGHNYALEATQDFKTWTTIALTGLMTSNQWWSVSDPAGATMRYRFYRLAIDPTNAVVAPPPTNTPPQIQVSLGPKPGSPMVVKFVVAPGHWYAVQATQDFKTWITIGQTGTVTTNGVSQITDPASVVLRFRYYRLAIH